MRSLFPRKSEFPAWKVTADISLDGQRVNLRSAVRDRIGVLVEKASDVIRLRRNLNGGLYFQRKDQVLTLDELDALIVSVADRSERTLDDSFRISSGATRPDFRLDLSQVLPGLFPRFDGFDAL